MDRVESYFQKHQFLIHTIGGLLALAVTLTAFFYTNFVTKAEATESGNYMDKRLDRIEKKLDHIIEHLPRR